MGKSTNFYGKLQVRKLLVTTEHHRSVAMEEFLWEPAVSLDPYRENRQDDFGELGLLNQ
jgi:hypothetical protein